MQPFRKTLLLFALIALAVTACAAPTVDESAGGTPASGETASGETASGETASAEPSPATDTAASAGVALPYGQPESEELEVFDECWYIGEVECVIGELDLEITDESEYLGVVALAGRFATTEISGCWTDETYLSAEIDLYLVDDFVVGQMRGAASDDMPSLWHVPGAKCTTHSDAAPLVTPQESIDFFAIGYFDDTDGGLYLMLEGDDFTEWPLLSGGSIGFASWMGFYLPSLTAGIEVGGLTGMFLSYDLLATNPTIRFDGVSSGEGSTTEGRVAATVMLSGDPDDPIFADDVDQAWALEVF